MAMRFPGFQRHRFEHYDELVSRRARLIAFDSGDVEILRGRLHLCQESYACLWEVIIVTNSSWELLKSKDVLPHEKRVLDVASRMIIRVTGQRRVIIDEGACYSEEILRSFYTLNPRILIDRCRL